MKNKKALIKKPVFLITLKALSLGGLFLLGLGKGTESIRGALSKNGSTYVLRWENSDESVGVKVFESPLMAVDFAQKNLKLRPGSNSRISDPLENLWVRREMGKQVIFWKTFGYPKVHRMTFTNESHANFFETSFKGGAYSPSPMGHAIYLVRAGIE